MADPKIVDFKPRWMQELSEEDRRILEDTPLTGAVPQGPPRLHTRLVHADQVHAVSFRTLSEALELTQAIVQYAGCDVVHGVNPDFADLRSAGSEVLQLTRLTAEPFEEGSFVIPARLEASDIEARTQGQPRVVTTQDVVDRFRVLLMAFQTSQPAAEVSIGAIQAIESLGRVIRREAGSIEYALFDTLGRAAEPLRVTSETLERVIQVRQTRRTSQGQLETLEGRITALDLVEQRLQLSLANGREVKGTFSALFQPSLVENLGRSVRLLGIVERRGKQVVSIQVQSVEVPDEE